MKYKIKRFIHFAITDPLALPGKLRKDDFIRFCLVGAVGFTVNSGMLFLLHDLSKMSIVPAQLLGAETAIISNFIFHNNWTYKNFAPSPLYKKLFKFHLTMATGTLINSLIVILSVSSLHIHYIGGLVLGSAAALGWNFFWTRHFIWQKQRLATKPKA